ncbi:phenylalanine--tRNA ligase subunit beta [Candidatus Daviesbacteria bacterium]|nr:phenylalanine--tRNA ligase subunit beta [Candidatus Daviesbacteria bacterium]
MKVSISWLKELVDLKVPVEELIRLLPLRTIGTKEITDDFIELDMKGYNRADLLSMRGVAREVVAITDSKLNLNDEKTDFPGLPTVDVDVQDKNLCPVYCVAAIENLKVEHSNETWVKKLSDCGIRSINNVADVTNLVMLEYGQPLHAFDARGVKDQAIIVRTAEKGERITTLDGKTRDLDISDLLITDSQSALGLAGVMGGKDSEVSDSTTAILLEAAIFDPVSIRRTAQRHGLPSEAAKRFQHGLTKTNLLQALAAAIKMYESLGGKLTAITLIGDLEDKPKTVNLTQAKINSLIGVEISPEQVEEYLKRVGANVSHLEGGLAWHILPPYWRLDIEIEEDLIEEVARMYGYEKIPPRELEGELPEKIDQSLPNFIYDLKKTLADVGLTEVQTYSFYSTDVLNNLEWNKENLVKVANPISSETQYLRDNLWPNLLEVVAKNIKNGFRDVAIFEIGKVYQPQQDDLPKENYRLSIAVMNGTDNPLQELNQIYQGVKLAHLQGVQMKKEYFHPVRFSPPLAEVHPRMVNKFGTDQRVAILEVDFNSMIAA